MCKMDLVMDMGSANTVIIDRKKGLVLSEPTIIAVKKQNGRFRTVAVGEEARTLSFKRNKPDGVYFIYPITGGTVTNSEAASLLVKAFLERITQRMIIRPQFEIMSIVSCGLHTTERKEFENIFYRLGIKSVTLVEAPIAAASRVVAGCHFAVIMGGGITDIAIVTEKGIVTGCSIDISAAKMDEAIMNYIYATYNVTITKARAADLRVKHGTLSERQNTVSKVNAKDMLDGHTKSIEITSQDIRAAIAPMINTLCEAILGISNLCPSNLVESINHAGLHIYGGVAGLKHLDRYLMDKLNLPIEVHADVNTLAQNCAVFFEDKPKLYRMLGINVGGKK
ncbi:MAG: rod shape-determining protein [Clostridia bacterium]|nr:rod shape-determining protein [Clostridia bacterium]